ncbi:MAG: hypothetical protein Q9218_001528 [Villophora microphyllina]
MATSSSRTGQIPNRSAPIHTRKSDPSKHSDRERRRRVFFHKLYQNRDDRKWDSRSEQILREDFLASERLWTEQQDRSAPSPTMYPDDDDEEESAMNAHIQADGMVDEVLAQENAEVEALVSMFESQPADRIPEPDESIEYGSEGENYDPLFMEILSRPSQSGIKRDNAMYTLTGEQEVVDTNDAMDTTGG